MTGGLYVNGVCVCVCMYIYVCILYQGMTAKKQNKANYSFFFFFSKQTILKVIVLEHSQSYYPVA